MLLERILAYLDNHTSYNAGVAILESIGQGAGFRRFGYVTPEDKTRLMHRLQEIATTLQQATPTAKPDTNIEPIGSIAHAADGTNWSQTPATTGEKVAELRERGRHLYKRQNMLHAEMRLTAHQPESEARRRALFALAEQIMEVQQHIDDVYERLKIYEKTGALPPAPDDDNFAAGMAAAKQKQALRMRASRLRRKIKTAPQEAKPALELRLKIVLDEIAAMP